MTAVPPSLLQAFRQIVGDANVVTDSAMTASYTTDWTGRWQGSTACVLRPQSHTHVASLLRLCHDAGVGVVPQGGNTGLVGGSVPHNNEVVLSLASLTTVGPIDWDTLSVTVDAGVTVAALHQHAAAAGLAYGVDMASRESATVAGTIATDAGGIRVVRYGTTRQQVNGVEVALPNGTTVTRLDAVAKDTVGYALDQLFVGSEGSLGVITRAQMKLLPRYDRRVVALVALDGLADAVAFARTARAELDMIDALELMVADGVELVARHTKTAVPFATRFGAYVLIELAAKTDPFGFLAELLEDAPMVRDAVVAVERPEQQRLWGLREGHTEAINATATRLEKFDVSVPLPALDAVITGLIASIGTLYPTARVYLFGHLAEGNLHVNVCDAPHDDDTLSDLVLGTVAANGGSISSEHGLGQQKTRHIGLVRSADEQALYRSIKAVCDPKGIMNPGVIVAPLG